LKVSDAILSFEQIPESTRPRFDEPPRVDESTLVLSDIEIPFHHADFINHCIALAKAWGIQHSVWAGDFAHWSSLASFPQSDKDTEREIEEIESLVKPFITPFERILYLKGNHDVRPGLSLDRIIPQSYLTRLFIPPDLAVEFNRKVTVSDYFYCLVGDAWQIEHPKASNTVPANSARALANTYEKSVAMGHNHLLGFQQSASGKHWGFEIGCCVDVNRLAYPNIRHTTRPRMSNGALILRKAKNGVFYPHLLSPDLTDWDWEMRKGEKEDEQDETQGGKAVNSVRRPARQPSRRGRHNR
jgi:hypothetical protein